MAGTRSTSSSDKAKGKKVAERPSSARKTVAEKSPEQTDQPDSAPETPTPADRANERPTTGGKRPSWQRPPKALEKIAVTNPTVNGVMLPFTSHRPNVPTNKDGEELLRGPYLTSWALNHVARSVSRPAIEYFKNDGWNVIARYLERRSDIAIDTLPKGELSLQDRKTNADACFHQLFGQLRPDDEACSSCKSGYGPFTECVQIEGSCANCRYNSSAVRCDFHEDKGAGAAFKTPKTSRASSTAGRKRTASNTSGTTAGDLESLFRAVPSMYLRLMADVFRTAAEEKDKGTL